MGEVLRSAQLDELESEFVQSAVAELLDRFSQTPQPIRGIRNAVSVLKQAVARSPLRSHPFRIVYFFNKASTGSFETKKAILGKVVDVQVVVSTAKGDVLRPQQLWVQIENYQQTRVRYLAVCFRAANAQ